MKQITLITSLFLLIALISCSSKSVGQVELPPESAKKDELSDAAIEKLFMMLEKNSLADKPKLEQNEIRYGDTILRVKANVDFDGAKDNQWVYAVNFETRIIDGKETVVNIGSIGIGSDRPDAVETAVDEWVGLFGSSVSNLLSNSGEIRGVEKYKVFPGFTGIRGEAPEKGWLSRDTKMHQKIISAIDPVTRNSNEQLNSVMILLVIRPNGEVEGECRFNNAVSQEMLSSLKTLKWPVSKQEYVFKQFYLLRKT